MSLEEFGIIPQRIYQKLRNDNWNIRVQGLLELEVNISDLPSNPPDLETELSCFLDFYFTLLDDTHLNLQFQAFVVLQQLIAKYGESFNKVVPKILEKLFEKWGATKLIIRRAASTLLSKLVSYSISPNDLSTQLSESLNPRNWSAKEEIINFVIYLQLKFPKSNYPYDLIINSLCQSLTDVRIRVQYTSVEALAVVFTRIGEDKMLSNLEKLREDNSRQYHLLLKRFQEINKYPLPVLSETTEGVVEHKILRKTSGKKSKPQLSSRLLSAYRRRERKDVVFDSRSHSAPSPASPSSAIIMTSHSHNRKNGRNVSPIKRKRNIHSKFRESSDEEQSNNAFSSDHSEMSSQKNNFLSSEDNDTRDKGKRDILFERKKRMNQIAPVRRRRREEKNSTVSGTEIINSSTRFGNRRRSPRRHKYENQLSFEMNTSQEQFGSPSRNLANTNSNAHPNMGGRELRRRKKYKSSRLKKNLEGEEVDQSVDCLLTILTRKKKKYKKKIKEIQDSQDSDELENPDMKRNSSSENRKENRKDPLYYIRQTLSGRTEYNTTSKTKERRNNLSVVTDGRDFDEIPNSQPSPSLSVPPSYRYGDKLNSTKRKKRIIPNRVKIGESSNDQHTSSLAGISNTKIFKENELPDVYEPDQEFDTSRRGLTSQDWSLQFHAITSIRRMVKHSPEFLYQGDLHGTLRLISKYVNNLRSQVSRNAILCIREMYVRFGRRLDSDLKKVFSVLLKRVAVTNHFLLKESEGALITMVNNASGEKSVSLLVPFSTNKSQKIREVSAMLLYECILTLRQKLFSNGFKGLENLGKAILTFLSDRAIKPRKWGQVAACALVEMFENSNQGSFKNYFRNIFSLREIEDLIIGARKGKEKYYYEVDKRGDPSLNKKASPRNENSNATSTTENGNEKQAASSSFSSYSRKKALSLVSEASNNRNRRNNFSSNLRVSNSNRNLNIRSRRSPNRSRQGSNTLSSNLPTSTIPQPTYSRNVEYSPSSSLNRNLRNGRRRSPKRHQDGNNFRADEILKNVLSTNNTKERKEYQANNYNPNRFNRRRRIRINTNN